LGRVEPLGYMARELALVAPVPGEIGRYLDVERVILRVEPDRRAAKRLLHVHEVLLQPPLAALEPPEQRDRVRSSRKHPAQQVVARLPALLGGRLLWSRFVRTARGDE